MATVVNARDVILQATSPRVATIDMAPNLVVDQTQVTGLGLLVEGTKLIYLQASTQIFQYAKTGTITPASTTLTAILRNITATPTLSVVAGTVTPTPTLSGANTVVITPAMMLTDTATFQVSVTDPDTGNVFTDEMTVIKAHEGSDAVNGYLTNESCAITADYLGNALSYTGASGTFKVFQGATDITTLCTFSLVTGGNPNGLTYTLNALTGDYAATGAMPSNIDQTTLTFRATFGAVTLDKVFTIAKVKSGQNGTIGQRGSRTFYVTLTGTTNTYSDTLAASTASADGGPVLNDIVTQYNSGITPGFSQSKFWDGTVWNIINAVVDGNLLVSGTVGATKISTATLSAIQASLGTVQIDSSGYIRTNGATAYATGTGIWLGWDSTAYKMRIGNPAGNQMTFDGSNLKITGELDMGAMTGYAWPAAGTSGVHLSVNGLLIGNANNGKYFQVDSAGNIYAPQFSVVNGVATYSGTLNVSSATTGQRTEIKNNVIKVFDAAGTLRVRLGDLTA